MGTVTAIGSPEPEQPRYSQSTTTTGGWIGASSTLSANTVAPSVAFDDWDLAIKFAEVIARQHVGVKVGKEGGQWRVRWSETYVAAPVVPYRPYQPPTYPVYPYVTYTAGRVAM